MGRRRRRIWYEVTVKGYWWCPPHGWVAELPETYRRASTHRRLRTMASAMRALRAAPADSTEVVILRWFFKKGRRYLREWERRA